MMRHCPHFWEKARFFSIEQARFLMTTLPPQRPFKVQETIQQVIITVQSSSKRPLWVDETTSGSRGNPSTWFSQSTAPIINLPKFFGKRRLGLLSSKQQQRPLQTKAILAVLINDMRSRINPNQRQACPTPTIPRKIALIGLQLHQCSLLWIRRVLIFKVPQRAIFLSGKLKKKAAVCPSIWFATWFSKWAWRSLWWLSGSFWPWMLLFCIWLDSLQPLV